MKKLAEKRVIRDCIHGYIHIDDQIIWDCINTREFQRLRRIRQLGSTLMVFPCGEHSRATHSFGTYEVARRMINEVDGLKDVLTEREQIVLMLAALLHDIGHASFSHSFEHIMHRSHEDYTIQIITGDSEVYDVLRREDEKLPQEVAAVINHTHPNRILTQLISSQLDADRLDYLLRDSYFTGTSYGQVDLDRILRTMRVSNGLITVKESSIYTVENYIMARYHMYWQVYYHPNSRSYDVILRSLFTRLRDLYQQDPAIAEEYPMYRSLLANETLSNDDLYQLDDPTVIYSFHLMENSSDPILKDLAHRVLNRDLFEYSHRDQLEQLQKKSAAAGYDPRYYVVVDHQSQVPYLPYSGSSSSNSQCIWMLTGEGVKELSQVSDVVASLSYIDEQDERVFHPRELHDD